MENFDKLFGDAEKMVSDMKNKKYISNTTTPPKVTTRKVNKIEDNHHLSAPGRINQRNNNNNNNANQKTPQRSNNNNNNQRTPNRDNTPPNKKSPYNKQRRQSNDRNPSPISQNFSPNNGRKGSYNNNSPNFKRNSPNPRNNVERDNQGFGRDKYSSPIEKKLLQKFAIDFVPIQFVKGETLIDFTREESMQTEEIPVTIRPKLFSSFTIEKIFPSPEEILNHNNNNISNDNNDNIVEDMNQNEVIDEILEEIQNIEASVDLIQIEDEIEVEDSVNINVIKQNADNDDDDDDIKNNNFIREIKVNSAKKNKSRRKNQNKFKNSSSNKNKSIPIVFEGREEEEEGEEEDEELLDQFNLQSLLAFCKYSVDEQLSPPSTPSLAHLSNIIPDKVDYYTLEYYSSESCSEEELEYHDDSDEVEIDDEIEEDALAEFSSDYSSDESDEDDEDDFDDDDDEEDDLDELLDESDEDDDVSLIPINRKKYGKIKISENGEGFIPRIDVEDEKMRKRLKSKLGDFELLDENFNFIDDPLAKLAAMKKFDSIVNGNFTLKKKGKKKGKKSRDSFGSQKVKNQNNYYDKKCNKKNKKKMKKQKSKNKLNTKTIDIFAMNREIKKFVLDDEEGEYFLPPMRKSCLSHVNKLAEYYSVRVTSASLPGVRLKMLQKTHKTKMPIDSDLQSLNEYIQSFGDFIGQRGKQLGKRKDQRLSGSPSDFSREMKPKGDRSRHKSKLVAGEAPPIESSNVGYILLKGMGWEGGALSQSISNTCDRIYSTPDGKPLTAPLPAIIKIGKNGIGF